MTALLIVGLFALLIGAIVALLVLAGKQRTQALAALATELELQFYPQGSDRLKPLLANMEFFSQGRHHRIRNLMMGKQQLDGTPISLAMFDYSFTIGRSDDTDTFCQSVLLFFVDSMNLPAFRLRPEHILDKFSNTLGLVDINFPDAPQFSKQYRLSGEQEERVRSLFQPSVLRFFERECLCVEAQGTYLLLYPAGDNNPHHHTIRTHNGKNYAESRFLQAQEIRSFLDTGKRLLQLLHR